ncbi:2-phospho-L-lactate guanylyltransferase [Streptomyces sp. ACA25]|uniref:2-phospho-L-lactate guanylyltransferase n=1 Tax=Streptomyces sp. ACA25 TaxID=3022596 RepID=UPI00230819C4|nr:2-phospho-L-lactate guanylyltransferase [Streptomyces sp. ACA25]MDB1089541.1 2-phospho-L-lactate guanylyltransferase [Streptomyces sp. ACA25]
MTGPSGGSPIPHPRAAEVAWAVILPVEPFSHAKAGFAPVTGYRRGELAHALFLDTLRAVRATECVGLVVVATGDPLAARQARTLGAVTAEAPPRSGLNTAVRHGAALVASLAPTAAVAALTTDLPTLRPSELRRALSAAGAHPRAFVSDRNSGSTTVLTACSPDRLAPSFGSGSRLRHTRGGAHELAIPGIVGLRLDVDTPGDLIAARLRGLGPYTSAILSTWEATRPALSAHAR